MRAVKASILIPVRNGAAYIRESLNSCFDQISKYPFEVIVINDHSSDETLSVAFDIAALHSNLTVIDNKGQKGVGNALNLGLSAARGEYIIRLDSDDRMLPGRIEHQIEIMEKFPELSLYGGQICNFSNYLNLPVANRYPTSHVEIIAELARGNSFADPTTCFRLDQALQVGGFSSNLDGAEQYDFWMKLSLLGQLANSEHALTEYRVHDSQFTRNRKFRVFVMTLKVQLKWLFGITQFQTNRRIRKSKPQQQTNETVFRSQMAIGLFQFLSNYAKHFIKRAFVKW